MPGQVNNYGPIQTFIAGGAITAKTCVKMSAADTVVVTTAITSDVVGVALETVASGERVSVLTLSGAKVKVTCSAAVTAGDQVMPGANGKCATSAGATAKSFGIALSTSAADNETVEVLTRFGVNMPPNA